MANSPLSLDEFRVAFETFRAAADKDAKQNRDSMQAVQELLRLYRKFDDAERAMADQVICEWALSQDEALRYDARALMHECHIAGAVTALTALAAKLANDIRVGTSDELSVVVRLLSNLTSGAGKL